MQYRCGGIPLAWAARHFVEHPSEYAVLFDTVTVDEKPSIGYQNAVWLKTAGPTL